MDHDQAFKNIVVRFIRQALDFFAPEESARLPAGVRFTPYRQEPPVSRLGDPKRILDLPILVDFPDGRQETLVFILEGESYANHFSPLRLAQYVLGMADAAKTRRVSPVVISLEGNLHPPPWCVRSETRTILELHWTSCQLSHLKAVHYLEDPNVVTRLCLVNMDRPEELERRVTWQAMVAVLAWVDDPGDRALAADYIYAYSRLDSHVSRDMWKEANMKFPSAAQQVFVEIENEGMRKGFVRGRDEGRGEGLVAGRIQTLVESIVLTLRHRGMVLTPGQFDRLRAISDEGVLTRLRDRAFTTTSPAALLPRRRA